MERLEDGGFDDTESEYGKALSLAITALEEIQQYRAMQSDIIKNNAELLEYRTIGTVEEFREAVEKQQAKKPLKNKHEYSCPICGFDSLIFGASDGNDDYCCKCGQRIDWSE